MASSSSRSKQQPIHHHHQFKRIIISFEATIMSPSSPLINFSQFRREHTIIKLTETLTQFRITDHGAIILTSIIICGHSIIVNYFHYSLLVSGSCVVVVADSICVFDVVGGIHIFRCFNLWTSLCRLLLTCSLFCNEGGFSIVAAFDFTFIAVAAVADCFIDVALRVHFVERLTMMGLSVLFEQVVFTTWQSLLIFVFLLHAHDLESWACPFLECELIWKLLF
jgi:hypothetical protein